MTKHTHQHHAKKHHSTRGQQQQTPVAPTPIAVTVECDNVAVDRDNLKECIGCCNGTARFFASCFLFLLLVAIYLTPVVLLFIHYPDPATTYIPVSGLVFAFLHFVYVVATCIGWNPFASKEPLFARWRFFCKWIAPPLLYVLLWLPAIMQQTMDSSVDDNTFRRYCVIVVCVFWTFPGIILPLTWLAMVLFKPVVPETKPFEPSRFMRWVFVGFTCGTYCKCGDGNCYPLGSLP